jgi:hypothetical protein
MEEQGGRGDGGAARKDGGKGRGRLWVATAGEMGGGGSHRRRGRRAAAWWLAGIVRLFASGARQPFVASRVKGQGGREKENNGSGIVMEIAGNYLSTPCGLLF